MPRDTKKETIHDLECPRLVLAGPGAGKTHFIAARVKGLLKDGTDKSTISALTFGREATQHMIDKLIDPVGHFKMKFEELPQVSTMHSLGLKIVREKPREVNLRKTGLRVQENEKVKTLMYRDAALILGFSEEDAKNARECKQYGDCTENSKRKKCRICRNYWGIMSKCNFIDFDDQILFACRILEKNPDILEEFQSRAKHLLVDEYQDINAAQFRLIERLSAQSRKGLFVVGDDAQSIYGFRGANPKFILRFDQDFPNAQITSLAHSWRCHQNIMDPAFKVLETFYDKWSGRPELEFHAPLDDEPYIWQLPSNVAEADMVAKSARHFINEKKSVLVLAPKEEFFPLIIEKLCDRGVPHECPISFLPERVRIAKLFVDWVTNPNDSFITRLVVEHLIDKGIAHVPGARKDGRSTPETIKKRIAEETAIATLWESVDKHNDLFSVICGLTDPSKTLRKIRDGLNLLLESFVNFSGAQRGDFVKQLSVVSGIWADPSHLVEDITTVVSLLDTERPTGSGSVLLKTMRKAKGLEADVVFVVGLEDDLVPNPRNDLIEEARLFFVSMTRASQKLYLFHAFKRPRNISYGQELTNKPRSKFLDAIGRPSEYKKPKPKKQ
jgi:DNA helicase-2/ATP-dependent DNA helicase PcrA